MQNIPFQVAVQYKKVPKCRLGYLAYKSVPHDPLELEAAQQCFQDLIQKLHTAITVLHEFHWEHLDIILSMIILNTNPRTGKKGGGGGWERGYHYSENSMRALSQCKIQWNLKFHISQLWSRFFKNTVRLYACSIMICRRLETAQRPIQYLRPSFVPRPHPAFHRLQYGKAGEGLV